MTSTHAAPDLSTGTDYDALASRFRPIFARIAAGTAAGVPAPRQEPMARTNFIR